MSLQILYEDNHLIAVNKPAGIAVQADESEGKPLDEMVKEYIKVRYEKPGDVFLGVIHRIDKPVTGLVLFARTSKALERMNKMFQERTIEKIYYAVTEQRPEEPEGQLLHYLIKDRERNLARASVRQRDEFKEGKEAILNYKLKGSIGGLHLLEVKPLTGRPHQIRVQLSKIDCPIRGDVKYGAAQANAEKNIHLHAARLIFEHPIKKEKVSIYAPFPKDAVWNSLKAVL